MLDYENIKTNDEPNNQNTPYFSSPEVPSFNSENAKKQRLIASIDKLITDAKNSEEGESEIVYRMSIEDAILIRDSIEASSISKEKDTEKEITIDDVFPIKDDNFWDVVDATTPDSYGFVGTPSGFNQLDKSDHGRYALETFKKFYGEGSFDSRKCVEIVSDILSEHSETPDLIDKLGLTGQQKTALANYLIERKVNFMSDELLHNPEKFADFCEKYDIDNYSLEKRYENYFDHQRVKDNKPTHRHQSIYEDSRFDDLSDECKDNLPRMLKNLEEYFDLTERDFDKRYSYTIFDGYLAENPVKGELDRICPLTLCDKDALNGLSFWGCYDEDYEVEGYKFARRGEEANREWIGSGKFHS